MIRMQGLAAIFLLSSAVVLPGCSMFDKHDGQQQATYTMPQPAGVSVDTIKQAQAQMKQEGDYDGAIDGIWGPSTEEAVRSYQQHHNLPQSGQLDSKTMETLNLSGHDQTNMGAPSSGTAPSQNMSPARSGSRATAPGSSGANSSRDSGMTSPGSGSSGAASTQQGGSKTK